MKKVNEKKGFTLAELLVVLAILAILVAVAIPIFSGAIGSAKDTAKDANARAIRAAAVVEILTTESIDKDGPWMATATVSANGDMTDLDISTTIPSELSSATEGYIPPTDGGVDGEYKVLVHTADTNT